MHYDHPCLTFLEEGKSSFSSVLNKNRTYSKVDKNQLLKLIPVKSDDENFITKGEQDI